MKATAKVALNIAPYIVTFILVYIENEPRQRLRLSQLPHHMEFYWLHHLLFFLLTFITITIFKKIVNTPTFKKIWRAAKFDRMDVYASLSWIIFILIWKTVLYPENKSSLLDVIENNFLGIICPTIIIIGMRRLYYWANSGE